MPMMIVSLISSKQWPKHWRGKEIPNYLETSRRGGHLRFFFGQALVYALFMTIIIPVLGVTLQKILGFALLVVGVGQ